MVPCDSHSIGYGNCWLRWKNDELYRNSSISDWSCKHDLLLGWNFIFALLHITLNGFPSLWRLCCLRKRKSSHASWVWTHWSWPLRKRLFFSSLGTLELRTDHLSMIKSMFVFLFCEAIKLKKAVLINGLVNDHLLKSQVLEETCTLRSRLTSSFGMHFIGEHHSIRQKFVASYGTFSFQRLWRSASTLIWIDAGYVRQSFFLKILLMCRTFLLIVALWIL